MTHSTTLNTILFLSLALILAGSLAGSQPVRAQTGEEVWSTPVNLSRSGGATNPIAVVDAEGTIHVIWEDTFTGFKYTSGDLETWSEPVTASFPFEPNLPRLIADADGNIHAFWTNSTGVLFHSQVVAERFGVRVYWEPSQQLASVAAGFDVTLDEQGILHLAYVRSEETINAPAGIYYRRSTNGGFNWSVPEPLYLSPYLRSETPSRVNVHIASAAVDNTISWLYVVWDNSARKRVFLTRSEDRGDTWEEPLEVDRPDEAAGAGSPFNIQVAARGAEALLLWQAGEPAANCALHFQWSGDGGRSWGDPESVLEEFSGCPQPIRLLAGEDGLFYLMTTLQLQNQIYLLAWDGERWSDPQLQRELTNISDPETLEPVDLGCRQIILLRNELAFLGCDTAGGGDIWITRRALGGVESWFPPPPLWRPPEVIATAGVPMGRPVVLGDESGRLHVLWTQVDESRTTTSGQAPTEKAVFYTRWDGERWTRPTAVLELPGGVSGQPTVAIDRRGRLNLVASETTSGELFYTWADAARAFIAPEWTSPVALLPPDQIGRSPHILTGDPGQILVMYAVPINERRGIYMVRSGDSGATWSEPVQIFDGAAAGWEMVGGPLLTRTTNRDLHALWTQNSIRLDGKAISLVYARSEDGGETWTQPEPASAPGQVAQTIVWSQIAGVGERVVHRIWQAEEAGRLTLWHQMSLDSGLTWGAASAIQRLGETAGAAALAEDRTAGLHLVQMFEDFEGNLILRPWTWDGERWLSGENLEPGLEGLQTGDQIGAAITGDLLGVAFTHTGVDENDQPEVSLAFSAQQLDLPGIPPTPLPTLTPIPTATPPLPATPAPTPTATIAFPVDGGDVGSQSGLFNLPGVWGGSVLGVILAGLIVAAIFVVALRSGRGKARY